MRNSTWFAVRFTGCFAAGSCLVAIAIGRMCAPAPSLRSMEKTRLIHMPIITHAKPDERLSFLDTESGRSIPVDLPPGETVEWASCSPWHDAQGRRQFVGRWESRSGDGAAELVNEFGLARFSFPDGEALNRIPLEITPRGTPCWYPGTTAKILFTASDGGLYRFAFEGSRSADATPDGCDTRPQPIPWKVAPPGEAERSVHIADPVWPEDRAFGGLLFVALSMQTYEGDQLGWTAYRIWWLRLDREGSAIEAAGPLMQNPATFDGKDKGRFPRPVRMADGRCHLAFLSRDRETSSWDLCLAPIVLDGSGLPHVDPDTVKVVAERCAPVPPAFSADSRWLYFHFANDAPGQIHPFPVAGEPAARRAVSPDDRENRGE
ncbi:MAG: hypothetical protein JWN86_141 [Planctomycetota bacterium]|nr:hypothetical protein [Planctomycetota bacterium]